VLRCVSSRKFDDIFSAGLILDVISSRSRKRLLIRYTSTCLATTLFNALLLKFGVARMLAFWGTLGGFGVVNFFLLNRLMGQTGTDTATSRPLRRVGDDVIHDINRECVKVVLQRQSPLWAGRGGDYGLMKVVRATGRRVDV